jgi:hypothetical protein
MVLAKEKKVAEVACRWNKCRNGVDKIAAGEMDAGEETRHNAKNYL